MTNAKARAAKAAATGARHCFDISNPPAHQLREIAAAEGKTPAAELRTVLADYLRRAGRIAADGVSAADVKVSPVDPDNALTALRVDIRGRLGEALRDYAGAHGKTLAVWAIQWRREALKAEGRIVRTRHYVPVSERAIERIDAAADAEGFLRGVTVRRLIEAVARSVGIPTADAPRHRGGDDVECDPDKPGARGRWTHPDGLAQPYPVYADIDGRTGRTFELLKRRWGVGDGECINRVAAFAMAWMPNGGAQ